MASVIRLNITVRLSSETVLRLSDGFAKYLLHDGLPAGKLCGGRWCSTSECCNTEACSHFITAQSNLFQSSVGNVHSASVSLWQ